MENNNKLQKSYTTREQSQRLIELGLPMDSADCFYRRHPRTPFIVPDGKTITEWFTTGIFNCKKIPEDVVPCWTTGRLVDIYLLCTGAGEMLLGDSDLGLMELIIKIFDTCIDTFDFSKLK